MTDADKVRALIARADAERSHAAACDDVQLQIRLGSRARIFRQITTLGTSFEGRTTYLSVEQTQAVYQALDIVRTEHLNRAYEIEKELRTP